MPGSEDVQRGLSPRERGNRALLRSRAPDGRSIPARAGEPLSMTRRRPRCRVYPRASGGTPCACGLSQWRGRSIPARAGEPRPQPQLLCWPTVYPRASGGTSRPRRASQRCTGLSPRERGNRRLSTTNGKWERSIPARAGEPSPRRIWLRPDWVYPRASGGTFSVPNSFHAATGLSPRERGNLLGAELVPCGDGSIPARAGEPSPMPRGRWRSTGLSPRERGNRNPARAARVCTRSIPARAGEPLPPLVRSTLGRVYPRASGGTLTTVCFYPDPLGLSPRERGDRVRPDNLSHARRSIPARAGEPRRRLGSASDRRVYPRASGGTYA